MRPAYSRGLVVAVLMLFSAGCSSNEGKIEGTRWSSQAMNETNRKYPAGHVTIDFAKNGKVIFRVGTKTIYGNYTLGWGSLVTINLDEGVDGKTVYVEKMVIDGNHLTMSDWDGDQATFNKVR